jgi:hypothetical protein
MGTLDFERIITNLTKAMGYIKYARKVAEKDEVATSALLLALKAIKEAEALLPGIKEGEE